MTLAKILRQKLSEAPPCDERHEFNVVDAESGWTANLTAERRDAWSTVLWELSIRRGGAEGDAAAWAHRVAERTSGLLEALGVVEVDAPHNRALLRSAPPNDDEGKISFYEVVLQATNSALVRRFEGSRDAGKRQQVPFVVTNEVLTKWINDLTTS